MENQFEGKVAIITHGGSHMGRSISLELAKNGAFVLIVDGHLQYAAGAVQTFAKLGLKAKAYQMKVTNREEVDKIFRQVITEFGRLDILVNNAELLSLRPFEKISEKEWDRIIDVNLKGTFLSSQAAFRVMKRQGGGKIINVTSHSSRSGGMLSPGFYIPHAHYAASKAAIESLTRSMAFEGAPYGIQVNAVSPGPITKDLMMQSLSPKTRKGLLPVIPLARLGRPEEIARAVAFLASERASYITAKILDVNGGILMD